MSAGTGGFGNAPVSKGVFVASAVSSVAWQASKASLVSVGPLLSPFARVFVFQNTGELLFGVALLYYFRILERQAGSAKFGSFACVVSGLSLGLQTALHFAYNWRRVLPTGPYGLIFACFVPFVFDVPPSTRFSFLGMQLSDKAFVYLAGLQLILSSGLSSAFAALCGVIAGATYRSNMFGMRKFMLPSVIKKFFGRTLGRVLDPQGSGPQVRLYVPRNQSFEGGNMGIRGNTPHAPQNQGAPRATASPEAIQQLVGMGFEEARVSRALETTGNDVQAAISLLVERG
ncbi:hypothetical protein BSKO_03314 [Bryopsis sp. KO-2023]|nr:hypothetical protein BSKO_03314 [Bryopsis sp. KO-2023]